MRKLCLSLITLVIATALLLWGAAGSQFIFTLGSSPGNPPSGKVALWANTVTGLVECLSSVGANCLPGGTPAGGLIWVYPSGSGDQTAINNAVSSLPSTGGIIMLAAGTFSVSASVVIDVSNVTLQCQGRATTITLANASNTNVIKMGATGSRSNIVVRDCIIDGNMANQTSFGDGIWLTSNCVAGCQIKNVTVQNTTGYNIEVAGAGAVVADSILKNTKVSSGSENIAVEGANAVIDNITCSGADNFALYGDAPAGKVVNSIFLPPTTNDTVFMHSVQHWQITNNYAEAGTFQTAINAYQDSLVNHNVVIINNDGSRGIVGGDNTTIQANLMHINNNGSDAQIGMEADGASLLDNVIIDDAGTGSVTAYKSTGQASIVGNNYTSTGNRTATGIDSGGAGSTVSGNIIDSATRGIYLSVGGTQTVIGNIVEGRNSSGLEGILVSNSINAATGMTGEIITGNTVDSFGHEGIRLEHTSNSIVSGNHIVNVGQTTNNTYAAILLTSASGNSTNNTIIGNTIRSTATNKHSYGIRENDSSQGPNTIIGNIALNAVTAQISTQNASTVLFNSDGIPVTPAVGVGSLPACGSAVPEGARAWVNDSNAASLTAGIGAVVAAGGSTHVPVVCDGTNWRIG